MTRPKPLLGRVEDHLIVYRGGRRRFAAAKKAALADGTIDGGEAIALLRIVETEILPGGDAAALDGGKLCKTVRHVNGALSGADGLGSVCVARSYEAHLATIGWGDDESDPPPAAPLMRAA